MFFNWKAFSLKFKRECRDFESTAQKKWINLLFNQIQTLFQIDFTIQSTFSIKASYISIENHN